MKKNENKILNQSQVKFSPSIERKKIKFNKYLLKDFEKKNILLSSKKLNDDLILSKENKNLSNTSNHKRTKSNSINFIQSIGNKKKSLNKSTSELSFFRKNEFKTKNIKNNFNSVTRNQKYNDNIKEYNLKSLLLIDFSLKEFRNKIVNSFFHDNLSCEINKNKRKIINLNNNNLKFNLDKSYNKEETRNATSISGSNNTNIIANKNNCEKEEKKIKSIKHIINKRQSNENLLSLKTSSTKKITHTHKIITKEKEFPKYNLNIPTNKKKNLNSIKKYKQLNNKSNLILAKHTFQYNHKFVSKGENSNFSLFNRISGIESNTFNYLESYREKNKSNRSKCSSAINNKNIEIKNEKKSKSKKSNKKRKEIIYKERINYNYSFNKFKSVEEIHFLYVYFNQKKKEFFKYYNLKNI